MKIEITKPGSRKFYEEVIYVQQNSMKVRNNPTRAVKTLTGYMGLRIIGFFIVALVALSLAIKNQDMIYMAIFGVLVIAVVAVFVSYRSGRKKIYEFMDDTAPKTIEIDGAGIGYISEDQTVRYTWDEISCVMMNKHSFIVIPKEITKEMIFIDTEYKEQVLKGLKDYGHGYLLEDNVSKDAD